MHIPFVWSQLRAEFAVFPTRLAEKENCRVLAHPHSGVQGTGIKSSHTPKWLTSKKSIKTGEVTGWYVNSVVSSLYSLNLKEYVRTLNACPLYQCRALFLLPFH